MSAYTGALSFTDDARNAAVDAGVMVKTCIQASPATRNVELLGANLVSKVLLQQQVHEIVGDKLWTTTLAAYH